MSNAAAFSTAEYHAIRWSAPIRLEIRLRRAYTNYIQRADIRLQRIKFEINVYTTLAVVVGVDIRSH